jgi:hypothetical protein
MKHGHGLLLSYSLIANQSVSVGQAPRFEDVLAHGLTDERFDAATRFEIAMRRNKKQK